MATVNSNIVTPQQAALNKKKDTNPLLRLAGNTAGAVSNAIFGPGVTTAAKAVGSLYTAGQQPTAQASGVNLARPQITSSVANPGVSMFAKPATQQPAKPLIQSQASQPVQQQGTQVAQTPADKQTSIPQSLLGDVLRELISRGKTDVTAPAQQQIATAGQNVNQTAQQVAGTAARQQAVGEQAQRIAADFGGRYEAVGKSGANAAGGYRTTGTNPVGEGNAAVIAQNTAALQQAIAQGGQLALQGTQQQATAEQNAANALNNSGNLQNQAGQLARSGGDLAISQANTQQGFLESARAGSAPVQVPYSNQLLNPATGQPMNPNAGDSIQSAVQLASQKVDNGSMSYEQAIDALAAYGQQGVNMLQQALGPNFDVAASNANAAAKGQALSQNVTQGRQVELAKNSAVAALGKLDAELANLSPIYKGGIPLTNAIASDIANFLGQSAVSQYQSTLNDARSQVAAVLSATGASTPTDAMNTARGYLPDGMTPAQQAQKVQAVKELIQQKVDAYTQTGNVPQYNSAAGANASSGGSSFNF